MEFKELKKEIIDRINFVQFLNQFIPLKKKGKNYFGNCPFHNEKTASFSVSEDKKLFYCFGCLKGGDVYQFLMEYKSYSFYQALCELADFLSISIKKKERKVLNEDENISLLNIFNKSTQFFNKNLLLKDNKIALTYLKQRGILEKSINQFKLGFIESSASLLIQYLTKEGFSLEKQIKSGLIRQSNKNSENYYCYFYSRLIFPIFDEDGRPIAFGARVLNNYQKPKYINSYENPFFIKKNVLYGFNLAKESIKKQKTVYIVEGYLDVIKMFQEGIENVLAPLGTALTINHLRFLSQYVKKIYLLFDSDSAGMEANYRALNHFLDLDDLKMEIFVISLPEKEDPESYIHRFGLESFLSYIYKNEQKLLYFFMSYYFKKIDLTNSYIEKRKYLHEIYLLISKLKSWIEREEAIQYLAFLLKVRYKSVLKDYDLFLNQTQSLSLTFKEKNNVALAHEKISILENPELYLALFFVHNFSLWKEKKQHIVIDLCKDMLAKKIFFYMDQYLTHQNLQKNIDKNDQNANEIYNFILENLEIEEKQKIQFEFFNEVYKEFPEKQVEDLLNYFKKYHIRIKIKRIDDSIKNLSKQDSNFEEQLKNFLEDKQFWLNEFYKFSKPSTRKLR